MYYITEKHTHHYKLLFHDVSCLFPAWGPYCSVHFVWGPSLIVDYFHAGIDTEFVFYQYGLGSNDMLMSFMTTSTIWGITVLDGCWSMLIIDIPGITWTHAGKMFTVFWTAQVCGNARSFGSMFLVERHDAISFPISLLHYLGQSLLSSVRI